MFCKSNPNFNSCIPVYLYPYIPIYLYHVYPVNPVKKIFMRNEANLQEADCWKLEATLPNEPNYASSSHSVASVAKKLFLQNKPNLKITCLCNLCNLWFQFLPNEPKSKAAQTSGLEG